MQVNSKTCILFSSQLILQILECQFVFERHVYHFIIVQYLRLENYKISVIFKI